MALDYNNVLLLGIEVVKVTGVLAIGLFAYQASQRAKASIDASHQNAAKIEEIKVATDGMKSALVEATATAERSAGRDEERTKGEQKAAALAEGQLVKKEGTPHG